MRKLPMLLNGHGVRATMDGTKTMTRRPARRQPPEGTTRATCRDGVWRFYMRDTHFLDYAQRNPLGVPGDLLYVRETWHKLPDGRIGYRASPETSNYGPFCLISTWRPSIHMPKWAARLWVRNTGVRVERVQDITIEDIRAEGIYLPPPYVGITMGGVPIESDYIDKDPWWFFEELWDSIYAKRSLGWDANPWVWVTSYEVTER